MTSADRDRFDELVEMLSNIQPTVSNEIFQAIITRSLQSENEKIKALVRDYFHVARDPQRRYVGYILNKKYKLDDVIGAGASGVIFEAEHISEIFENRRKVAVKIINPGFASENKKKLFIEEIRSYLELKEIAARYHILPIIDADVFSDPDTNEKIPFCVMPLLETPKPITDYVKENQSDVRQRLEFFLQICEAIQYAHSREIIHGDLKPENILVDIEDNLHIIDWGLAYAHRVLKTKSSFGTPGYIAPELIKNDGGKPKKQSDIYALGIILFEMLENEKTERTAPDDSFLNLNFTEKRPHLNLKALPKNPSLVTRKCRKELNGIIAHATYENPSDRYTAVEYLKNDIHELMTELSIGFRFLSIAKGLSILFAAGILIILSGFIFKSEAVMSAGLRMNHAIGVLCSFCLFLFGSRQLKSIRPILNSTFFFSYAIGVIASFMAGILYAFGPLSLTDIVARTHPIWYVRFIRFMIPGIIIPFFYAFIFALAAAKRKDTTFKAATWSTLAWLILVLVMGTLIRASINLYSYGIKYSGMRLLLASNRQGDVRFEYFLFIAFLSVFALIIFENWKIVKNTGTGSSFHLRGFSFTARLICSLFFCAMTSSVLAALFWGRSMTPSGANKMFNAACFVGLLSGWGIGCYHLFTGRHSFIRWIDKSYVAKRARCWKCSKRIEPAREKCKDVGWLCER